MADSSDDDNTPLAKLREVYDEDDIPLINFQGTQREVPEAAMSTSDSDESFTYDSDKDPEFNVGVCEVTSCKKEVWSACPICEILLCYDHANEDISACNQHGEIVKRKKKSRKVSFAEPDAHCQSAEDQRHAIPDLNPIIDSCGAPEQPEDFTVEGSAKETRQEIRRKTNKKVEAKAQRNKGEEYTSPSTKKRVEAKGLKPRCSSKCGRKCDTITDEQRQEIFDSFYSLGELSLQREFIARHIKVSSVGRKRNKAGESRRNVTKFYYLTVDGEKVPVCQKFFLNTLSVSETACRTVTKKTTSTGILEKDRRGGRQLEEVIARDKMIKKAVTDHINRFPRVESHFCRSSTSREYLSNDLNIHKMYNMFLKDWAPKPNPPCNKYYEKIFKTMNLSFHSPKKDQCSLCMYIRDSEKDQSIPISDDVRMRFEKHIAEKQMSRQLKQASTERAARNPTTVRCATFDLQQVIYLPKSNESAIFYKRRLANLNLTFYDINRKSCESFTWHEGVSKRGASEISSCVYQALQLYDQDGVREVDMHSDGCADQNKNSIMPAMMLYTVVNSRSLQEISLRYFESFHGQNEGDSVHSSISTAMKGAGNLFIPSQLIPVFSLSRKNIHVHQLQFQDFIDFKLLSKDLRILDSRKDSDDTDMNWNDIMEVKVTKRHPDTIFYKTSHLDDSYSTIPLKRLKANYLKAYVLNRLNKEPNKISKEKYQDLISLCSGDVPVIRHQEHKDFYFGLPHND